MRRVRQHPLRSRASCGSGRAMPGRTRVLAVAALLGFATVPGAGASAQTFYGCTTQGNCESLQFAISTTPNERGHYFASLTQTLDVVQAPAIWHGADLTFSAGAPLMGPGPDDIDHPFSNGLFFTFDVPRSITLETGAFFSVPSIVTTATLLIEEHPTGAPPGVFGLQRIALTQIGPVSTLPEPGTVALVGGGLALVGVGAWRRRRTA